MPLQHFIMTVARGSRSKAATMLIAIIYLNRLREKIGFRLEPGKATPFPSSSNMCLPLSSPIGGPACACHRVAFAAIMISHKLWNDVTFIGKQWAQMSNMFDAKDVLSMERELLTLLKYDLKLSMIDISRFSSVIFPSLVSFVHRPLNFHYSPPTAYIETNHASTHVYPSIPVWGPRFHSNMAHIPPPG